MGATSCSFELRKTKNHFVKYLHGNGIDIGAGDDPLKIENGSVVLWDLENGDAQYLKSINNEKFDFVYSSHCLEHMRNTEISLYNWSRVLKKDGFLFVVVPEYILYEKMQFPSVFNTDHKNTYSCFLDKEKTKRDNHFHSNDIVKILENLNMEVLEVSLEDQNYDYNISPSVDQTRHKKALAQILFVAKKKDLTPVTQHNADDWVLSRCTDKGFFVDCGCFDGEIGSNTYKLEKYGWKGICIDAFPKNFQRRPNSTVVTAVVHGEKDLKLEFTKCQYPELSGLTQFLGRTKWEKFIDETIEVKTTLLHEILDNQNAPKLIDYLNLDIEGNELEVLKTFPFDKYTFKCISLEHAYDEPKRTNIRNFLKTKGYKLFKQEKCDDWFYHESQNQIKIDKTIDKNIPIEKVKTDYGEMIILTKDTYQSNAFRDTKKAYDWEEVDLLNNIVKNIKEPVFFDIGANLGAFTLGLAKNIKQNNGVIFSFEPQKVVHNCLSQSIELNDYNNINLYHAAIGNSQDSFIEVPQFDYSKTCSFGSIEFGESQKEKLHQDRLQNPNKEYVPIYSLDSFIDKIHKLDLLKIDVEGMEESVLDSAKNIIAKFKPTLFVEFFKSNKEQLLNKIKQLGYTKITEIGVNFLCTDNNIENIKTNKIGLCMIVKNEEKIIERCLNSVKPLIDYVLIVDTGSTDNTVKTIENWLLTNNITGKVLIEPWKDFAYNRSFALEKLRENKNVNYALMIDADEILTYDKNVNIQEIKKNMTNDLYNIVCKFGSIEYLRNSICKNDMPFYYKGVVHEFLECKDHIKNRSILQGIYNVPLQDSARNQNTKKFQKDVEVLHEALKQESDDFMKSRYTFYLAQSYRDCGEREKSMYWYNERAKQGFWNQEIYISLYNVAKIKEALEYPGDDVVQSYLRAHEICPERIEALHGAMNYCRRHGRDHQAYILASYARNMPVNKTGLFVESWIWDYGVDDEFSIVSYWTNHINEGVAVTEKLLKKIPENQKPRVLKNLEYLKGKVVH